jgi:hypothetical protein
MIDTVPKTPIARAASLAEAIKAGETGSRLRRFLYPSKLTVVTTTKWPPRRNNRRARNLELYRARAHALRLRANQRGPWCL